MDIHGYFMPGGPSCQAMDSYVLRPDGLRNAGDIYEIILLRRKKIARYVFPDCYRVLL